jgi:hypothetical protein
LIEFAGVVDAVRCAVEVQQAMAERNAHLPEARRIEFRMGIVTPHHCPAPTADDHSAEYEVGPAISTDKAWIDDMVVSAVRGYAQIKAAVEKSRVKASAESNANLTFRSPSCARCRRRRFKAMELALTAQAMAEGRG